MSQQTSLADVAAIIESISGVGANELTSDIDLLDLGLDSLMFVRIGRVIESRYQVEIPMKRFYDELSNLGVLAAWLDEHGAVAAATQQNIQADAITDAAPVQPETAAAIAALPAPPLPTARLSSASSIDAVMAAHMALMQRYLAQHAATSGQRGPGTRVAASAPQQPLSNAPPSNAPLSSESDAIETRRKFSGIDTARADLSAEQAAFVAALAQRLSSRCARSKQLAEEGKTFLADWKYSLQFKQDLKELRFPIVCERASGARFVDVDGNEYVDIAMGMGVHYFGHSPRFVDDAVRDQLQRNVALGPQSSLASDVARRICALTGHERAAFFVTGSDAVMLALRLVRAATGRRKVVMFAGAYHGICSDILAGRGERQSVPMSPGLPPGIVDDLVVLDYDAPESLQEIRALHGELAGVLVEPVQSRNPALQPQRFLRQLRALCTELEVPLIFDEMVNGFRQAAGGMQEWFGVRADLSTYGKIIGGGYPLSVIAGKPELMRWIDGGIWHFGDDSAPHPDSIATGGTHNKHPVALAAAAAVLTHIEHNPALFEATRMRMHGLADRLNVWFEANAVPLRLTYFGTQFKFESYAPALELELFFYLLLEQGVYTWELHVANLSTEHDEADLELLFKAVVSAVGQLRAGGFAFRAEKLRRQYLPMSSVQRRLYAITQRNDAELPYHLAGIWRLRGNVDVARLEDCFHQVILRHESLRSAFVVVDGGFYQRIVAEPRFFLDRLDARGQAPEALLEGYIRPFNLLEPPLLRAALATEADSCLLLIDVHHLVADGLSMNVVLQEVLALYDGMQLEPVRMQARHVHEAMLQYLDSDVARKDAAFWSSLLAPWLAARDSFDLASDLPRPAVTNFAGQRLATWLDADFTAALHARCRRERCSTFSVLLAAFLVWISHYAGRRQFMVGLPASGRPDEDAGRVVGMFVNTLVFPAEIDPAASVGDYLHQVRDRLFELQAHGDYPFGALLETLQVRPLPNRNPLFDVMFSYEHAGSRELRTNSFVGETLLQYEGAGMFDISFDLIEADQGILVNCAFARSLFHKETMEQRLQDYLALLQGLVEGPEESVAAWLRHSLSAPVPAPKAAVLPLPVSVPGIAEQWQQQLVRRGDAIAVLEGERSWRYDELDTLVRESAFALFNLYGVRPGDRVLVSLDSSCDLVVAMLALLSMGAVYVPVTPETPPLRARSIQRQCQARHLICAAENAFAAVLHESAAVECLTMQEVYAGFCDKQAHQALAAPAPDAVAYVIFTSGSTGEPKGVEVLHAGIANAVAWRVQAYEMGASDTTLQMPSAAFDASVIDILCALLSGGRLVLLDTASKRVVERVRDAILQHGVTAMLLTPTLYRVLLERIPAAMASLRFLTLAGEKLPPDLAQQHFAQAPAVALWNEYGPTECSVVVSGGQLSPQQERISIGHPITNIGVHVLDEQQREVATGQWGRLWVSGVCLARGYVGDELTTAARFRCLPALDGLRCYDTGDVVRRLASGELEYRGREDSQVKINGHRIELEEIEAALREQCALVEVAVCPVERAGTTTLHAWAVATSLPGDWREALAARLPAWMLPTAMHTVTALPLLPSGKLDRSTLAASLPAEPAASAGTAAAVAVTSDADANAQVLLSHCREVLGRPQLQLTDHYFNAGGDSVQAIVLASRLHEAGLILDINDLFRHPVLADLVPRLEPRTRPVRARLLPDTTELLPTPLQAWCFEACQGALEDFSQAALMRLPEGISLRQLETLCRHWVEQHPVFADTQGMMALRQGKALTAAGAVALVQCSEASAAAAVEQVASAAQQGLDPVNGPLLRVVLLPQQTAARALVVLHHFVIDAVSWQILQAEWQALWSDIQAARPLRRFHERATMRQFAAALHQPAAQAQALGELAFWQQMLPAQGSSLRPCPGAVPGSQTRLQASAVLAPGLADTLLVAAHDTVRTRGAELLLVVYADVLARHFGLDSVSVLMEAHGRTQNYTEADFSSTVGWMTSAYPLSFKVPGSDASAAWPARIECLRDAACRVPAQGVGYGILRYLMQHEGLRRPAPHFAFNYLGRFNTHTVTDFALIDTNPAGERSADPGLLPALEFVAHVDAEGLHIGLSAAASLFDSTVLQQLLQDFARRAADLAAYCRSLPARLPKAAPDLGEQGWSRDDYLSLLAQQQLSAAEVEDVVPLTPMQQSLVYHARTRPGDTAYLEQVDFTLHHVEPTRLAQAFQSLLQQFPQLRAAFLPGPRGRMAQLLLRTLVLPVACRDLSGLAPDEQQRLLAAARLDDQQRQFDIARAPLMRVQLFTLERPDDAGRGRVHVIWTHHHLLMDGWCVGILFDALLAAYVGADAVPKAVPPNTDYFQWLQSRDRNAARSYWAALLEGVEGPTRLSPWPTRGLADAATAAQTDRYSLQRHEHTLPATLVQALQRLAASRNATLGSVLRLAWATLLARFCNVEDVVFGTVVSGRPPEVAGIERAVGLFINTIPIRFRLGASTTVLEALESVQQQANAARAHEHLSLADIQDAAPDLRAREPLFDHLLVFENYPMEAALRGTAGGTAEAGDKSIIISDIAAHERTDLPLNVVIVPQETGLQLGFVFDAQIYPVRQIEHLATHLGLLLAHMAAAPDQALTSLDLLTADEREYLWQDWNATAAAYPQEQGIFDLYRETAQQHGTRPALKDEQGSLTHAELLQQAQALAAGLLQDQRFAPGQRVALWLPRNREMIIAMLGVLAAGGSYVPLDPVYPDERLGLMVRDSESALLVTSDAMPQRDFAAPSVSFRQLLESGSRSKQPLPSCDPAAEAYVIYTSGSTGQPKGCAISQRNVVRLLRNERFDFDFDHRDVWVLAHSFCFDFSVWEIHGALLNGGCLVIPEAQQVRDVEAFVALVEREQVTVLNQTPAAFHQFARLALQAPAAGLDALRMVIFGGDLLQVGRLQAWVERYPTERVKLVNMYGITETTVHVTYKAISVADITGANAPVTVGRPLPETTVWIVDRWGKLLPPGIPGEIVVGGSGVGMGYINRPALNAQKFRALPDVPGAACYWSGDVGWILPGAGLVYQGRNDHQVQVRGFRVECDEIARCFETHQSVREAVVLAIETRHGTELVAYLAGDAAAAPAQWRSWLTARLPEYMVPAYTVWLQALPLTRNGKLDRAALPDPLQTTAPVAAPQADNREALIMAAWREILGAERDITPDSNFFDLGGHSLKALTLVDLLRSEYRLQLSVNEVFSLPTPQQQAAACRELDGSAEPAGAQADGPQDELVDALLEQLAHSTDATALEAMLADLDTDTGSSSATDVLRGDRSA